MKIVDNDTCTECGMQEDIYLSFRWESTEMFWNKTEL